MLRSAWRRLQSSDIGKRLASGAFWALTGNIGLRGLMLLASVVVGRLLGLDAFGELGVVQSTVAMFQVFAGMALGTAASKFVAEFRLSNPGKTGRVISLSLIVAWITGGTMAIVLVMSAPWVATHTLGAPQLTPLIRISSLMLLFGAVLGAQTGALSGFEAFRPLARTNIVTGLVTVPLLIAGAAFAGVQGAVIGLVIGLVVNCALTHRALQQEAMRHSVSFGFSGCYQEWPVLLGFCLPATLGGLLVAPVNWICCSFLVNQPGGFAEMGLFNAASQWRAPILLLPTTLGVVALPLLSHLHGKGAHVQFRKVLWTNLGINGASSLLLACTLSLFSPWIMLSYGESFRSGALVLIVLAFSAVLIVLMQAALQVIASHGRMWETFVLNLLWACTTVICAWLLRHHGAVGLGLAGLIGYFVDLIAVGAYMGYSLRHLSVPDKPLASEYLHQGELRAETICRDG